MMNSLFLTEENKNKILEYIVQGQELFHKFLSFSYTASTRCCKIFPSYRSQLQPEFQYHHPKTEIK